MEDYKRAYFLLFSAICDEIERLEALTQRMELSEAVKEQLQAGCDKLKTAQQTTEELLIS